MLGRSVTVVLYEWTAEDGYVEYKIVRKGESFSCYPGSKIIHTTEGEVLDVLEKHDVPHERESDVLLLSDQGEMMAFLTAELNPEYQDNIVADLSDHASARVEGYTVYPEEKCIDVDYTFIPGL